MLNWQFKQLKAIAAMQMLLGAESGWVEARSTCDHLPSLCPDPTHIPVPNTPCSRCEHPAENWLCLSCKEVLCSRFVNKHMLSHHQETGHSLALSFSDLSVWCFSCEAYLDVQLIRELHPVYEIAHLLKFGERPPFRSLEIEQSGIRLDWKSSNPVSLIPGALQNHNLLLGCSHPWSFELGIDLEQISVFSTF